ncbi:MAG TPA: hypothetical protein VKD72_00430 [Gemmataceae bacterium]|nr:hypothetical protein [Gemmataceae bacterium]
MPEQKFPVMYHSRLWRFAPKILYNQADLDNFLAVVTLADWVKSPDPPIDPAEAPKYESYPKTLYSVNINAQVVENSNQEALMSSTYHPLELSPADIEAAKQTAEQKQKQAELEAAAAPPPPPDGQFAGGQPPQEQPQQPYGQPPESGQWSQPPGPYGQPQT